MAPSKKTASSPKTRSSSSQVSLKKVKGENFYRNAKAVGRLKMLNGGKAVRDKDGKIIQAAAFQKGEDETKPGRVQPDRRWFGARQIFGSRRSVLTTIQAIQESSHKLPWTTSAPASHRNSMIRTQFFCGGTNCLWRYWTTLPIRMCARFVSMILFPCRHYLTVEDSGHTLSRQSLSRTHLVRKLSARSLRWASGRSRSSAK